MDRERFAGALSTTVGSVLAGELVDYFIEIRQDLVTRTLERSAPGKFIETFVQCLQQMATGNYDAKPDVDLYLNKKVENETTLSEDFRICAARVARAIYTFRNKRGIAHKNTTDPSATDLAVIYQQAVWIMTELLRHAAQISIAEASELIELVQAPVNPLIERIGQIRLVHADVSIRIELLILLHDYYPDFVKLGDILKSMENRSSKSVRNQINALKAEKLVFGDTTTGYRLTRPGDASAISEIKRLLPAAA